MGLTQCVGAPQRRHRGRKFRSPHLKVTQRKPSKAILRIVPEGGPPGIDGGLHLTQSRKRPRHQCPNRSMVGHRAQERHPFLHRQSPLLGTYQQHNATPRKVAVVGMKLGGLSRQRKPLRPPTFFAVGLRQRDGEVYPSGLPCERRRELTDGAQPFTPPAVSPSTSCFWRAKNNAITGTLTMIAPAAKCPQSVPWSPM